MKVSKIFLFSRQRKTIAIMNRAWLCSHRPWLCSHRPWLCSHRPWLCSHQPWLCRHTSFGVTVQQATAGARRVHLPNPYDQAETLVKRFSKSTAMQSPCKCRTRNLRITSQRFIALSLVADQFRSSRRSI